MLASDFSKLHDGCLFPLIRLADDVKKAFCMGRLFRIGDKHLTPNRLILEVFRVCVERGILAENVSELNQFVSNMSMCTSFHILSTQHLNFHRQKSIHRLLQLINLEPVQEASFSQIVSPPYCPDSSILKLFLDDVHCTKGNDPSKCVNFLKHYFNRYCEQFPENSFSKLVSEKLMHYIDSCDHGDEKSREILSYLELNGYVAFSGGYGDLLDGHAVFYELSLDDGHVIFRMTNSGEGLKFHPKGRGIVPQHQNKLFYYRTLSFKGADLQSIVKTRFIEKILSFNQSNLEVEAIQFLYKVLFYAWPGSPEIIASNLGGAQRGSSCALRSVMKWMHSLSSHSPQEVKMQKEVAVWIKMESLMDYVQNSNEISASFLDRAFAKISSHCSKMLYLDILSPEFEAKWDELSKKIKECKINLKIDCSDSNKKPLVSEILKCSFYQQDNKGYSRASLQLPEDFKASASLNYDYIYSGKASHLAHLEQLFQENFAPPQLQSACYLNFLRFLPDCHEFSFEKMIEDSLMPYSREKRSFSNVSGLEDSTPRKRFKGWDEGKSSKNFSSIPISICKRAAAEEKFFRDLATVIQSVASDDQNLFIGDGFLADLMNGWMILYYQAKKKNSVSIAVFHEWISALLLLIEKFKQEYIYDTHSFDRINLVEKRCNEEIGSLSVEMSESGMSFQPLLWQICDKNTSYSFLWAPYKILNPHKNLKAFSKEDLSATSLFIYEKYKKFIDIKIKEDLYKELPLQEKRLAKIIRAAEVRIPQIPLYDQLRESLWSLYISADIHLKTAYFMEENKKCFRYDPYNRMRMNLRVETSRPFEGNEKTFKFYPEVILSKRNNKLSFLPLNHLISKAFQTRQALFFTHDEEIRWFSYVKKHSKTAIFEVLRFFKGNYHKFSDVAYQSSFEHLFFNSENHSKTQIIFSATDHHSKAIVGMIFNFILEGNAFFYEIAEDSSLKIGGAPAFLLYIHNRFLKLCSPSKLTNLWRELFFQNWKKTLLLARKNHCMAYGLADAMLASISIGENNSSYNVDKEFYVLMLETLLYDCSIGAVENKTRFSPMRINYGYLWFVSGFDLFEVDELEHLLKSSCLKMFAPESTTHFSWDPLQRSITLSDRKIHLDSRKIEGREGLHMQKIPKEITKNRAYKSLFETEQVANFSQQGKMHIYTFNFRNGDYKIICDKSDLSELAIFKKFDSEFLPLESSMHFPKSVALERFSFWKYRDTYYVENIKTEEMLAIFDNGFYYRLKDGKLTGERLAETNSGVLKHFDVRYWMTEQGEISIELPNENLHFVSKVDQDGACRYYCIEYPGFKIADSQETEFLADSMGIILENHRGQKKAVVSYHFHENKKCALFDFSVGHPMPELIPIPKNYFAIFLLLKNYFRAEKYEDALKLLKDTKIASLNLNKMQDDVKELLWDVIYEDIEEQVEEISSMAPEEAALRLHLYEWEQLEFNDSLFSLYLLLMRCADNYNIVSHFLPSEEVMRCLQKKIAGIDKSELNEYMDVAWRNHYVPAKIKSSYQLVSIVAEGISATNILDPYEQFKGGANFNLESIPFNDSQLFVSSFLCLYSCVVNGSASDRALIKQLVTMQKLFNDALAVIFSDFIIEAIIRYEEDEPLTELKSHFENVVSLFRTNVSSDLSRQNRLRNSLIQKHAECVAFLDKKLQKINYSEWMSGHAKDSYFIRVAQELKISFPQMPVQKCKNFISLPKNFYLFLDSKKMDAIQGLEKNIIEIKKVNTSDTEASAQILMAWCKNKAYYYGDDLLIHSQFQRLIEGCQIFSDKLQKSQEVESLTTNVLKLRTIFANYMHAGMKLSKKLRQMERRLVFQANDKKQNIHLNLEEVQKIRRPIDIQTLLISFGRRDISAIKAANPALYDDEIFSLMKNVGYYALLKSELQQIKRCQSKLKIYYTKLKENSPQLSYYSDEYLAAAGAKRVYNVATYPELLIFEVFNDLLIREEQLAILDNIFKPNDAWKLIEAKTGLGKSRVISPLWLILKADRQNASIMIIPSGLYEQQVMYTQTLLKNGYNYFATCIYFSRDSDSSPKAINAILSSMKEAKDQGKPILMSDSTAHNLLILKIKELCQTGYEKKSVEALLNIQRFVKDCGVLFVDEPHDVLNDCRENDYSIGNGERIDAKRLELCVAIYRAFLEVLEKNKRSVEFYVQKEGYPLLTEEEYDRQILPQLLEKLIKGENFSDRMRVYLQGKLLLQQQLEFENDLRVFATQSQSSMAIATKARLLHDQLHHFLPQTIQRNNGEHYGFVDSDGLRIAIPLEAARTAKDNYEFVSQDQMINFTIQANLKVDFSAAYIFKWIEQIVQMASKEIYKGAGGFEETKAYQQWRSLISTVDFEVFSPFKVSKDEITRLTQFINENTDARLQFTLLAVLQKMHHYDEKVCSSPHLLVNCFKYVVGASGTLAMQNFPYQFEVVRAPQASAEPLVALLKKCEQSGSFAAVEFNSKQGGDIVKELSHKLPDTSVVIEIGAIFRSYTDLKEMALEFLKNLPQFEGIATFDVDGIPVVLSREFEYFLPKNICGIDDKKLYWLYLQKDIVGTDQRLDPFAKGVAIVNKYTTLTNFIQGIGRMRDLCLNQEITIATDSNSAGFIRERIGKEATTSLTFFDILEYCLLTECEIIGNANIRSLRIQHQTLIENLFWQFAREAGPLDVFTEFQRWKNILVETTRDDPLTRSTICKKKLQTELLINDAELKSRDLLLKLLTYLRNENSKVVQHFNAEKFEGTLALIRSGMNYPKMSYFTNNVFATKVSQSQTESMSLEQREQECESQRKAEAFIKGKVETWVNKAMSRPPLNTIESGKFMPLLNFFTHHRLKKFWLLFENAGLFVSEASMTTFEGDSIESPGLVNGFAKPMPYLMFFKDKVAAFDVEQAAFYIAKKNPNMWLINHGPLCEHPQQAAFEATSSFLHAELAAKLLNGDLCFSHRQQEFFNYWLQQDHRRVPMLIDFLNEILFLSYPMLESSGEYQLLMRHLGQYSLNH